MQIIFLKVFLTGKMPLENRGGGEHFAGSPSFFKTDGQGKDYRYSCNLPAAFR